MSGTIGPYRRLTGTLRMSGSSPLLEAEGCIYVRLVTVEDLRPFDTHAVVVEGTLSGVDRLQVEWIAQVPA